MKNLLLQSQFFFNETTLEVWQPLKNQDEVQMVKKFVAWQVRYVVFANNLLF